MSNLNKYRKERDLLLAATYAQIAHIQSREYWRNPECVLTKDEVWRQYQNKKRQLKIKHGIVRKAKR